MTDRVIEDVRRSPGPMLTAPQRQPVLLILLVVQAMLALPVAMMLPLWLLAIPVLTGYWQWQVLRGRRRGVRGWLRAVLVFAVPGGVVLSGLHPGALDFYVALAFVGVSLKLLEMNTYRDAYLVAVMALFVLASLLLMDQGILYTLYVFLGVSLCLGALVRLHAPGGLSVLRAWQSSGRAVLVAVPFMLLLFVAFPRLPPIWHMPSTGDQAQTGLSDTMSPADIAELVQTNDVVFRAQFDDAVPARSELYWRAMTLNHFDGERWYQWDDRRRLPSHLLREPDLPDPVVESPVWHYDVALSATHQPWVATLEHLTEFRADSARWVVDNRLVWEESINQSQGFSASAHARVEPGSELAAEVRASALQLPGEINAQARELAETWRDETDSDEAFMARAMAYFAEEPFRYSLRPGRIDQDDAIDAFLFESQVGFCAHYAEALVFMARAADILARVVTGYLGGQWSDDEDYLVVRTQDAHAWVEVWLDGAGWVRYDPTERVAPARLDGVLNDSLDDEEDLRSVTWSDQSAPGWLQQAYWRWDNMQYRWQRWVLNFDEDDRSSLLARWLGEWRVINVIWFGFIAFLSVFGLCYGIYRLKHRTWVWGIRRFEHRVRRQCRTRYPELPTNGGLSRWADGLADTDPELAQALYWFADLYMPAVYGRDPVSQARRIEIRQAYQALMQTLKSQERRASHGQ